MEYDINRLREFGLNVEDGLLYTGGEDKYMAAVQRYMKGYESNRESIISSLEANDIERYKIKVHALKSNSRMIGAIEIGDACEALEKAATDNEIPYIEANNDIMIACYDRLIKSLEPLKSLKEIKPEGELDAGEALKVAEDLIKALEDFDDELSKKLALKLMNYPFRITKSQRLKEAIGFIEDFQYDEALEIVNEIKQTIE